MHDDYKVHAFIPDVHHSFFRCGNPRPAFQLLHALRKTALTVMMPSSISPKISPFIYTGGGGRKPLSERLVLEGIFYVFRRGCQWKAVPKNYGAASSVHPYFKNGQQPVF
ncbi:MAG: transposase [Oscillospiraceae bacterium]|nr:transposase [Oscillospiraceae bacterium]